MYKFLQVEFKVDDTLKDLLMLAFFTSVGLSADFASLKKVANCLESFYFSCADFSSCKI